MPDYDDDAEEQDDENQYQEDDFVGYEREPEPDYELEEERDVELLRDLIDDAEVDEHTGEVIIKAQTPSGVEVCERVRTIEEMQEFLCLFGWDTVADRSGNQTVVFRSEVIFKAQTPSGVEVCERVRTIEEMQEFLCLFGWDTVADRSGNQTDVFGFCGLQRVDSWAVEQVIEEPGVASLFATRPDVSESTLYRVEPGILVSPVTIELGTVNEALIRYLAEHPPGLYELEPRRFEELIAELFRDLGYEVLLTPRTRDGGIDIRAIRKDSVGTLLYLIECKRYRAARPVGVEMVRSLYGVTLAERASCGVLATTSRFTKDAQEFADRFRFQLSLRDYADLVQWLQQYPRARKR